MKRKRLDSPFCPKKTKRIKSKVLMIFNLRIRMFKVNMKRVKSRSSAIKSSLEFKSQVHLPKRKETAVTLISSLNQNQTLRRRLVQALKPSPQFIKFTSKKKRNTKRRSWARSFKSSFILT